MDFFKLIEELDEILYRVASWLLFYPITVWRMIWSPLKTMRSVERELSQAETKQFDDTVPPPLFLLLSVIVVHAIELGTAGEDNLITSTRGLSRLISSDTSLIVFRIMMFSLLPLAASLRLNRAKGRPIDSNALKASFYAQCYAAGLLVLLSDGVSVIVERHLSFDDPVYYTILAASLIWLLAIEARWFAFQLGRPVSQGIVQAAIMIAVWGVLFLPIAYLLR
jgi:hypothetical protein